MKELQIYLDPNHPQYHDVVTGLQENLRALESVKVEEVKRRVPPGTLGFGTEQVLSFIVSHPTGILTAAASLMTLINQLIAFSRRADTEETKNKPAAMVSHDAKVSFPASADAQRKFLKAIKQGNAASKKAASKGNKPKKRSGRK